MKGSTNHTSSPLTAFKRAPSLGLSQWENGNLTTNLAEKKDTNGAFFLVEATLAPGTEPPPHVHTREDELFYVLEGEFDAYVGDEAFKVEAGECVFLPRFDNLLCVGADDRNGERSFSYGMSNLAANDSR
jgi:quercetin dioxygenase-like cupin family protein